MKKKLLMGSLMICLAMVSGCNAQGTEQESEILLKQLEDGWQESEYIEAKWAENLFLAAEITPRSQYADGLNSYYIKEPEEKMVSSYEEEQLMFLEQPVTSYIEFLENGIKDVDSFAEAEITNRETTLSFSRSLWENGKAEPLELNIQWDKNEEGQYSGEQLWFGRDTDTANVAYHILRNAEREETELSFAERDAIGKQLKEQLETLINRTYSDDYFQVSVSKANYELDSGVEPDEKFQEYYGFLFYYSIDGFPWRFLNLSLLKEDDMKLDTTLEKQLIDGFLMPITAGKQTICYGEDGICFLQLSDMPVVEKICKEKETVCDISVILEQVKEYFDSQLLADTITISDIKLQYSSWFEVEKDGTVQNIVQPFWVIRYWDAYAKESFQIIYDAYTGNYIMTNTAYS